MRRIFILCLVSSASFEMQTVQHFYMSRKARSNSEPIKSGYVYTQVNNEPPKFSSFYQRNNDQPARRTRDRLDSTLKWTEKKVKEKCTECFDNKYYNGTNGVITSPKYIYNKSKGSENLKSSESNYEPIYDMSHDFHADDEDVRTDSRNYDGWPYFYHSLYEYEPMNFDMEYEKAKDKRFVDSEVDKVIPVHEHEDEVPSSHIYSDSSYKQSNMFTTDNPIYGNQPFFSYVLNDYFDKTYDDDPLNFKGISWEKELDYKKPFQDIYDTNKRIRRLNENNLENDSLKESINKHSYDSNHESENSAKGNDNKRSYTGDHKHSGQNYKGFKDFADAFLNKFGSEDHNKVAKYSIKNNADKGEKKKGFRKVYHKDEYQEHNEFFDDKNSSINNEENGDSKVRVGGSEALLRSQASAALGDNHNEFNKEENIANSNYDKNDSTKQLRKGNDGNYNGYRVIAKNAALSNNADYFNL